MTEHLNNFSAVTTDAVLRAKELCGSPLYLYDGALLAAKCRAALAMPNAFGIRVRYAMKANPNRAILRIVAGEGLLIDASSLNEVRRAKLAGIDYDRMILTTQEVPEGDDRAELERMMQSGLLYNACSLRQLERIGDFAARNGIRLSMRIHPGIGSGESPSRNTGDHYSCFGVHLDDLPAALRFAEERGIVFSHVHSHIGSGGDPEIWRLNIGLQLGITERFFPDADTVSFGGGLREARMPDETAADIEELGNHAKTLMEDFCRRTGRKLVMEIEPGTFIAANCGYVVTTVMDLKSTGGGGYNFVIADGGMEMNVRPLLYGSRHPFYVIGRDGALLSSEFGGGRDWEAAVAGKCCESGDCQTITADGVSYAHKLARPSPGDTLVIGGAGAYCSAMAPMNYNSHAEAPEVLLAPDGELRLIRRRQTIEQMTENEI